MKRLFYLMLVVLGTVAFTACSDDDDNNGGGNNNDNDEQPIQQPIKEIIMTKANDISAVEIYTFNLGDTITIDYGDGNIQEIIADKKYYEYDNKGNNIERGRISLEYIYSDSKIHTITIEGEVWGLDCEGNDITSLDVSKNTTLVYLDCGYNDLTSLDVTKNTELIELACDDNQLVSLDISNCSALIKFYCSENQLSSLDVSKNTALTTLDCTINQLTSLDISKNIKLTALYCGNNGLTSLDVRKNTALTVLYCPGNSFTSENMNQIYEALPIVESGILTCDKLGNPDIAKEKGWNVL